MSRRLSIAVMMSALLTFVCAMALRASDATLAVVAVAAVAVLLTWYAQLNASDEQSGADLVNPAAVMTLAVVGRTPWSSLLPLITAHAVGAVAAGLAASALDDQLGETLIYAEPSLLLTAIGAALVGGIGSWATLSVDGGGAAGYAAVPVVVGGAVVPLGLVGVFHPAVTVGLAAAGLVPWDVALLAAATVTVASGGGAYAVSALVPAD